jgi:hypothetical protein
MFVEWFAKILVAFIYISTPTIGADEVNAKSMGSHGRSSLLFVMKVMV